MTTINFLSIPDSDKKVIYQQLSDESKIPPFAVEKDWWVVQVLAVIFEISVGKHLVFKGGTSLSKAWNLISRFSEDVDLAIDPKFLGFEGELKKKDITALRKAANQYISNTFYPELKQRMAEKGFTNLIPIIHIKYSKNFFFSANPTSKKYSIAMAIQYFLSLS